MYLKVITFEILFLQKITEKLIAWLSTTPKSIVFRVNTILCNQEVVFNKITNQFKKVCFHMQEYILYVLKKYCLFR